MIKILTCKPMRDEVAWSHAARIAWLNGLKSQHELSAKVFNSSSTNLVDLLASAGGYSRRDYFLHHSMHAILHTMGVDSERQSRIAERPASTLHIQAGLSIPRHEAAFALFA